MRRTHAERLLTELRTGPKTAATLYRLGMIVHSRIADLRRAGCVITCHRTEGEGAGSYVYTLVSEPLEAASVASPGAASSGPAPSSPAGVTAAGPLVIEGQLDVFDVLAAA